MPQPRHSLMAIRLGLLALAALSRALSFAGAWFGVCLSSHMSCREISFYTEGKWSLQYEASFSGENRKGRSQVAPASA
jgi:hypothetical protein